jgi:phage terminase small subunit
MPRRTLTAKQFKFCVLIVEGKTQSKAYALAGYKQAKDRHANEANASKLLNTPNIQTKIAELRLPVARKSQITLENLTDELMVHNALAKQLGQVSAATGALALAARLHGLITDHKTVDIVHHKPAKQPVLKDLELSEDEWLRLYKPHE